MITGKLEPPSRRHWHVSENPTWRPVARRQLRRLRDFENPGFRV